ncbi:MAG: hypothetical protein HC930_01060 [Hydrococcus sp. SU_1_0]|nr:hypothetical protein [Hydrococcus sp. SU_1_0]
MTYEQIKKLKAKEFKRLCGVKPQLLKEMTEILEQELPKSKQRGGQPKLSIESVIISKLGKLSQGYCKPLGITTANATPDKRSGSNL